MAGGKPKFSQITRGECNQKMGCVGSVRGARGTVHIKARTTAQAREILHSYPKP